MAPLIHLVLMGFKADVSQHAIDQVVKDMFDLKDQCLHPQTNQPYINVSRGGKDQSIEGLQNGFTHAFVVEFESVEDRDHYVKESGPHATFVKTHFALLEKVLVLDFTPGIFK